MIFRQNLRGALLAAAVLAAGPAFVPQAARASVTVSESTSTHTVVDSILTIRPDLTAELVELRRTKVLKDSGLKAAGQQALTFIEGVEQLEILEAFTEKADGTRIDVGGARILSRDAHTDAANLYLADQKAKTVLFPNLAVGDTAVLKTRLLTRSISFPGQLVMQSLYSRKLRARDTGFSVTMADDPKPIPDAGSVFRIVAPHALELRVGLVGIGAKIETSTDETNVTHVITFLDLPELSREEEKKAALDRDPQILISSFPNYEALGRAYWVAVEAKAQVTPEVQALADAITRGMTDRRQQARAISRWVKRNIRYVALFSGNGRDVPVNTAAEVLFNRYGDCKDHTVLMIALLSAKGIASELALINLADAFSMPEPATLAFFNHAILYLPEFGVYDDPTAPGRAFGEIAREGLMKPVLVMSAGGARRDFTPAN